jgi:ribosomal protein S18 acetylase RimI-like enzyme
MTELPAGYTARPVRPDDDVQALMRLQNAVSMADWGVGEVDERLAREPYNLPSFNVERDSWLVHDADGEAAGLVEYYDGDELHVAPYVFLRVRPDLAATHLTEALLDWAARRAPENLPQAPEGARVATSTDVASVNRAVIGALERNGWRHDRTMWIMEIDLVAAAPLPEPAWPDGITVRTANLDDDARAIHATVTDAFSDHYGFVPQPYEEWIHFRTRFFEPEPDLWFLAMDGDEIAATSLCSSKRPAEPDLGWVSTLGVRRQWRRRGLGLALLQHSFRVLAERGVPRAGLGVDAQSLTGATALYEKAGMRVVREAYEYERVIREGRDLRTTELASS